MSDNTLKIAIIGLGYVGLPLACALSRHFEVIGFDIDLARVHELQQGHDRTHEVEEATLRASPLHLTHQPQAITQQDIYIVTVPTPVTQENVPDLNPLTKAAQMIGRAMRKSAIVVFESTVFPGVTEDICGAILAKESGLICGVDFYLGYSPERINPGDKFHTVDRITKVVAGQNAVVTDTLAMVYGTVNQQNIFKAKNIKTAEAAKVIENTQRDINIAFINEITMIFSRMGLSIYDVLSAAKTKWNFLPFTPGLVGGHCIGVDPYYLSYAAQKLGLEPTVILAGRKINESMSHFIACAIDETIQSVLHGKKARVLVLGLTFKEDIPDLRNTKVIDLIRVLQSAGHLIDVHDPQASPLEAKERFDIELLPTLDGLCEYDVVIGAVAHRGYLDFTAETFGLLVNKPGLVADIKNLWRDTLLPEGLTYWSL